MFKKQLLVFLALILLSPWFLIYLLNFKTITALKMKPFKTNNQVLVSEVNTLRGEAGEADFGLAGRLVVNKIAWPGKEILGRYLESFDSHFLFVEGDLDINKSTRTSGPIFLALLPFIIYGFCLYYQKGQNFIPTLVLFLPILGFFFDQHYETTSRLPFILGLTWIASLGLLSFFQMKGRRLIKGFFLAFLAFEYLRFIHYFILHYPYV